MCAVVDHALMSIGQGSSHVSQAYDYVASAEASGASSPDILDFLRCGSWGKYSQNIERDLFNTWLAKSNLSIELLYIPLKLDMPDSKAPHMVQVATLPPHIMLHALDKAGPLTFYPSVVGHDGPPYMRQWWLAVCEEPWYRFHPVLAKVCDWSKLVPIMIHMDGCEVFNNAEFYVWSWSSATVKGASLELQWPQMAGDNCRTPTRSS